MKKLFKAVVAYLAAVFEVDGAMPDPMQVEEKLGLLAL